MPNTAEAEHEVGSGQFSESLDRIWREIKDISRQVERETRRSGRIARLRLEARQLKRRQIEVQARLGRAVYQAHVAGNGELPLSKVEGLTAAVKALDDLSDRLFEKEREVASLQEPAATAEPAAEPA